MTFHSEAQFYVTGGTVPRDAQSYIPRQADEDLLEGLREGQFCYVLTSRQMGKSSLMVRTAVKLRAEGFACVIIDLTAIGQNLDSEKWYAGMLNQIGQQMGMEDELDDFWLSSNSLGPMQRFMQSIQQVILKLYEGQIVLFIDEIDAVRSLPFSADEFFAGIRECYNRRASNSSFERLTFCLLGVATPSDLIQDTRITPFNIGKRIELTDFTFTESTRLAEGFTHKRNGGRELLERVLHWTGGHPYLTQRLCNEVAGEARQNQDVDRFCKELFLSSGARDRDDNLIFVRERMLRSSVDLASFLTLYQQVLSGKPVPNHMSNSEVSNLKLAGVAKVENNLLTVRNRIYARVFDRVWVQANMPDVEMRRQRNAYRLGILRTSAVAAAIIVAMTALALKAVHESSLAETKTKLAQEATIKASISEKKAALSAENAKAEASKARTAERQAEERRKYAEQQNAEAVKQKTEAEKHKAVALKQEDIANVKTNEAISAHKIANESLLKSYLDQAKARRYSGQIGQRFDGLEVIKSAMKLKPSPQMRMSLRNAAIASMALPTDMRLIKRFVRKPDGSGVFAYEIERNRYFTTDAKGNMSIRRINDGHEITRLPGAGFPVSVIGRRSANGRFIAVGYGKNADERFSNRAIVWDLMLRKPILSAADTWMLFDFDFSPDNKLLAYASGNDILLMDTETGRVGKKISASSDTKTIRFQPAGKKLSWSERNNGRYANSLAICDLESGKNILIQAPDEVSDLAWNREGTKVTAGCDDHHIYSWYAVSGAQSADIIGNKANVGEVAYNHNGNLLFSVSWDSTSRLWNAVTGKQVLLCPYAVGMPHFSPDDRFLYGEKSSELTIWEVADCAPCRELTPISRCKGLEDAVFSADGKLLASCDVDSLKLWDTANGHEIGFIETGSCSSSFFSSDGNTLITYGKNGFFQWTLKKGLQPGEKLCVTPKLLHPTLAGINKFVLSDDEQLIGVIHSETSKNVPDHAHIMDISGKRAPFLLTNDFGQASIAISPDKRWMATGKWQGEGVNIWDARTGKPVTHLPIKLRVRVMFTPNGKSLLTGSETEYRFWEVGTWRSQHSIPREPNRIVSRSMAYTRDGRILAVVYSDTLVQLLDARTRKPLANLEYPNSNGVAELRFSADGTRLAVSSGEEVLLWDLREIRSRLATVGLDWDMPPYAASAEPSSLSPLSFRIPPEDLALYKRLVGVRKDFFNNYAIIKQKPNESNAYNTLAWLYVTGPLCVRDPKSALPLIEKAIRLSPNEYRYFTTLGVVYYRLGQYDRAVATLKSSLKAGNGKLDAFDLFFLAMSYQKQGKADQARESYEQALKWWKLKTNLDADLTLQLSETRTEAERELGIASKLQH